MMSQHDDEPRDPQAAQAKYTPFMPGGPRKANRAERRAKDQVRARARRRMERATIRAIKRADVPAYRSQDSAEDAMTVSVDLEAGTVTET